MGFPDIKLVYADLTKNDAHTKRPKTKRPKTKSPRDKTSQGTNEAHYLTCVAFNLTQYGQDGLA